MTKPNDSGHEKWSRLILFVLFLMMLALVLKGMGWCIGGVCDVGTEMILPGQGG